MLSIVVLHVGALQQQSRHPAAAAGAPRVQHRTSAHEGVAKGRHFSAPPDDSTHADAGTGINKTVVIFRHIEKTGGTSLRSSFQHSACQFFGYQMYWTTMFRIERFVNNHSFYAANPRAPWEMANTHSNVTACVEAHSPTPELEKFAPFAAMLRRTARVVLLMLVRRPDEHYISFFRWTHQPQQNETRETYSAKLLLWTPRDLQANVLLQSHRATIAGRAWVGDPFVARLPELSCGPIIAHAASFHVFDLAVDVDYTLRSMRDLTGLRLPPFLVTPAPLYRHPRAPPITLAQIQEAHGVNFTHRVRQLAPCDWRLHALTRRSLDEVRR